MTQTVAQIQTKVRWEARDDNFDLTDTEGLAIFNMHYRKLASLLPWSELIRSDTSLTTTAGTEDYTWPSIKYVDVLSVEIQNPYEDNKYKMIPASQTFADFVIEREKKDAFPNYYMRAHNGSVNVLRLAPAPDVSSLTIRITGVSEPTEVTSSSDTTVFLTDTVDDALAFMISADISFKRNFVERGQILTQKVSEILSSIAGREIPPREITGEVNA